MGTRGFGDVKERDARTDPAAVCCCVSNGLPAPAAVAALGHTLIRGNAHGVFCKTYNLPLKTGDKTHTAGCLCPNNIYEVFLESFDSCLGFCLTCVAVRPELLSQMPA